MDINDAGQIVGCATYNGEQRPFLLTPLRYAFVDFQAPVDRSMINVSKAGQIIPIRFSLSGDYRLDIFDASFPQLRFGVCGSWTEVSTTWKRVQSSDATRSSQMPRSIATGSAIGWCSWRGCSRPSLCFSACRCSV